MARLRGWWRSSAFTLVELMVVIVIVALLSGLLLPALSRARRLAKRNSCQSRLHQIGQALYLYAMDSRQRTPRAAATHRDRVWDDTGGVGVEGLGYLYDKEFLREPKVYYCPAMVSTTCTYDGDFPWSNWYQASQLVAIPYRYRDSLHLTNDVNKAIVADAFHRGVTYRLSDQCHKTGYNVLYLDSTVRWYDDPGYEIKNLDLNDPDDGQGWDLFDEAYHR